MNKILKRLLVCTLALLMVVNPLGACFATGTASGGAGGRSCAGRNYRLHRT